MTTSQTLSIKLSSKQAPADDLNESGRQVETLAEGEQVKLEELTAPSILKKKFNIGPR